ncbi:Flp pilus assembly complex ATPase component TadA [Candidatus Saccharibacteria bacterium]|nr:Flp pilus assembly complex ATPase component TadA [Candidatus Saccharibacteria bacterium]
MNEDKIQQQRRDHDESATQQRAAILGIQYLDLRPLEAQIPLTMNVLSVADMYKHKVVPLKHDENENTTIFGITTQTPQSYVKTIEKEYSDDASNASFALISNSGYRAMMDRFDPPKKVRYDDIEIATEGDSETLNKVSQTLASVGTEALFDYLIRQADMLGASDIHIENMREDIRVRMRVDGALHVVAHIEKDRYRILMGELGRRANVSTASKEPQSGHIQQEVALPGGTHLLNIRVETIPSLYGQDAVLRLFNFDESLLKLDLLGIPDSDRRQIDEVVSHPRGLVMVVGPTGSGKSTTLYSMLNALNTTDRKILTLEDPIEYGLTGITQIPVDTSDGRSFADQLRSVLRLDPDVVMVGEIRDEDSARTAIQASITGHLVLSSFHAASASAAFSRMIDLIGVNPIFSTAIRLVIAQRLVRRLHDASKQGYDPDEATKSYVRRVLSDLPESYADKPNLENFQLYRPVANHDAPFGYKGRMVIMEQLIVNDEIQKFIRGDVLDAHAETIEATAKHNGMVSLEQAGVLAALRGETTLEEINRVI